MNEKKRVTELAILENFLPAKTDRNFIALTESAYKDLKKVNYVQSYNKQYIIVTGPNNFIKEKKLIKQMYTRNMFNIIDYINPDSNSFTAYIQDGIQLNKVIEKISNDIEAGLFPFRYAVYLGVNTTKLKRHKFKR